MGCVKVKKNHITILNEEASGQYVRYAKLNIDPDSPIKIQAGQKFSIDMEMEIIKAIPIGARLKLENPSIPCISSKALGIDIGLEKIGSCEYDIQKDIFDGILKKYKV